MAYLSSHRPGGRFGQRSRTIEPTIFCFTNCDSVELFQDGKSLGSKLHSSGEILSWPANLSSGIWKAVGKKGNAATSSELRKAGSPSQLELISDVTVLKADGHHVAQIESDVTDAAGTLVPDAANLVDIHISGPGRILGIENADLQCTEDYRSASRHVYQGRLRIYLQSQKTNGTIRLEVASAGLKPASMTIDSQAN
jgi:beta-galactosidase